MQRHQVRLFTLTTAAFALIATAAFVPAVAQNTETTGAAPAHYTVQLGIHGYSPVSYFTRGTAEPGSPLYPVTHEGVTYLLTSPSQVATFNEDPAKYVPAYGGWCAFGAAVENHFPINPQSWKIVDGRLMLFLSNDEADALQLWNDGNEAELTEKADAFWANTHGG